MAGYIFRARQMFTGEPDLHDSYPSCMPFGAHYFYAFEMLLLGMRRFGAMAIAQAFCGALVTPFAMLTARETFRAPLVVPAVGLLVALWHPQLVFVGYFSSEIPFAALLMASLWLTARFVRNGEGPFLAGLVTAFAFTVRPQILLTFLLSLVWLVVRRERLLWLSSKKFAALLLPMVLVVSFSSIRNRLLTGEWRLISANSVVGRFFADTDYRRIVARQPGPDGRDRQIGYFPRLGPDIGEISSLPGGGATRRFSSRPGGRSWRPKVVSTAPTSCGGTCSRSRSAISSGPSRERWGLRPAAGQHCCDMGRERLPSFWFLSHSWASCRSSAYTTPDSSSPPCTSRRWCIPRRCTLASFATAFRTIPSFFCWRFRESCCCEAGPRVSRKTASCPRSLEFLWRSSRSS